MRIVALGDLPPKILPEIAGGLKTVLGVGWKPGPALDRPAYAFNETRGQYHAPAIVRRLSALRAGSSAPILGVVDGDLFLPDEGDFVLSDADRDAGAAVVALRRLRGDGPIVRRRAQVQAVHAVGRVLGLPPCDDGRCALSPSRDVAEADRKGLALCHSCRAALGST